MILPIDVVNARKVPFQGVLPIVHNSHNHIIKPSRAILSKTLGPSWDV